MDVRSKIVEQIDKSMEELKKQNPNFTHYQDKWKTDEYKGWDSKPQNVDGLQKQMSLVQRLTSISDWFGDLDEMMPGFTEKYGKDKYSKARLEEANKWMGYAKDKMGDNLKISMNTKTNEYTMYSDDLDAKGRPLYEWHYADGKETFTRRAADGSETTIIQK